MPFGTWVASARERKIEADDLGIESLNVLRRRLGEASKNIDSDVAFRHLDGLLAAQQRSPSTRDALLGELAYSAGTLARGDLQQMHLSDPPTAGKQLGVVLAQLAIVTASFRLTLEGVARANLEKINSRWPGEDKEWTPLFDDDPRLPSY